MIQSDFKLKGANTWWVMRDIYFNMDELASYVKKAPPNKVFRREDLASAKKRRGGSFNDFDSFEDALHAMEYGYDEHLESLNKEMKKARDVVFKYMAKKNSSTKKDVVGFMPIVPNVVIGNPINMINHDTRLRKIPVCKIMIEKAILAGVDAEDSIKFNSVLFTLIQLLEQKGIRCELWICATSRYKASRDEIHTFKVKLKDSMQPINIYKLQFPIISADMFRRIGFRIKETCPTMQNSGWTFGYGRTLYGDDEYKMDSQFRPCEGMQEILDIDENWVYIPDVEKAGMQGKDTEKILDYLLKKTALKHYIQISQE